MTSLSLDSDLWCRRFHPSPTAARRLVCFPHAGGSASFYFPVSAALHGPVDVLAVQYPGRQDRRDEAGFHDLHRVADEAAEALRRWDDLPLTLFGHSMGALVAFEVARRIERAGGRVDRLFVSGRNGPSADRPDPAHPVDDAGILAELREMSGTDTRLLEDEELLRMVLPALRADYRAVGAYRADREAAVDCPVTALVGDRDRWAPVPGTDRWRDRTRSAFDLRVFPGGHFYLSSRADEVTAVLREHLTGALRA
ncbi:MULTISPECIES: alpha/beta fold hydrolase [Kitasatospora]|uniref:Thioesterase II n=1 Tax=Kitasatospora setae (strain ATCC 33774 / DSM 43861 / JCM 3304 / KCC A-0304 / NBRC 14216 / KM-6054) TaxID=452652 RepID=E4NJG2_KITSK|nr:MULTISPECIES: alpha/beta fold hydrolase [Kitasatospora]BAJ33110.1 thioesterase II [Kitasatospora setae KM-6054]